MDKKDMGYTKLERLNKCIDDLREILNEVCLMADDIKKHEEKLFISRCLDELIVEYMKEIQKKEVTRGK
ncbi:Spo0E family sporulation regulatory protein-aspartic acid phosphatase [Cellulosilyticum sp. I15G10I2]|uniref:Spo0E family sporulation regulatory protein-aspartic acid phosphatase n=1 Tax=Cellulosilyticum sp. I15G10I2 TaxID=1892843 RepID=UPI001495E6E0|nr:Spo0E family sporulation regulatory protein-aspartic acid phosphatase [Cellulosilyticum sp. I15G10I2]